MRIIICKVEHTEEHAINDVFGISAKTGSRPASSQLMEPVDKQESKRDITLGNSPRLHTDYI